MKIHIVNENSDSYSHSYLDSYLKLFRSFEPKLEKQLTQADLVIFTGGEDITPSMYQRKQNSRYVIYTNPQRDIYELSAFKTAVKKGIPIFGICRGAQLCSVASGNNLIQHINNHSGKHFVKLNNPILIDNSETDLILLPASHHQLMLPTRNDVEILGTAYKVDDPSSKIATLACTESEDNIINNQEISEVEIAWFKNTNSLGIQPHPEWETNANYASEIVKQLMLKTILK